MTKSETRIEEPSVRIRHYIAFAVLAILWASNEFIFGCDLSMFLLHPIDDINLYAPVLFFSILIAWVHRDVKLTKEVNLEAMGKIEEIRSKHELVIEADVLASLKSSIKRNKKEDSILYVFNLTAGAYSTLCIARAIIER